MSAPHLPEAVRLILKAVIMSLANAGLLSSVDADHIIALLGLQDA